MLKHAFALLVFLALPVLAEEPLELYVGEQKTLNVNGAVQIAIAGQGRVARGTLSGDGTQVIVSGVAAGDVSLTISYKDGKRETLSVRVIGREADELYSEAKRLLSDASGLTLRRLGREVELSGDIKTGAMAKRVRLVTERFPEILNFTRDTRLEQLIQMDVEIVELSLSDGADLGVDWFGATSTTARFDGGVDYGAIVTDGNALAVGEKSIPDRLFPKPTYAVGSFARLNPLTARINFLVTGGKASVLARPKLVCRSGDSAVFLSGGEVPIPYITQEQVDVKWKEYGTRIKIHPFLTGMDEAIEMRIYCEISDVDWANSVNKYPALARKYVETKVAMKPDEVLALAGLISKKKSRVQKRLPFLGAIPFLGRLFSSTRDELKEVETVVLLVPRIINAGKGDNISTPKIK